MGNHPGNRALCHLNKITLPTLIVPGNKDIVVGPINALTLAEHLPNAQLIMYSLSVTEPSSARKTIPAARGAVLEWRRCCCIPKGADRSQFFCRVVGIEQVLTTAEIIHQGEIQMNSASEKNKRLVLEAFETLFNKRDYAAAERFWSPDYIQHSALIEPGRDGLFNLVRTFPPGFRWESGVIMAEGNLVMVHSRYLRPGVARNLIAVDILRIKDGVFVEHWDVLQDEVSKADSKSGHPMFGTRFPYWRPRTWREREDRHLASRKEEPRDNNWKFNGGIMATTKVGIAPMKVAQISKPGGDLKLSSVRFRTRVQEKYTHQGAGLRRLS